MTNVVAISGKVKFDNTGKTQYRVETLLNHKRSGWKQHFDSFAAAVKFIESKKECDAACNINNSTYLVTEVFTKTLGVF